MIPELKGKILAELARRNESAPHKEWKDIARPEQLPPPGDWKIWCVVAGRGFGKTRMGAEAIKMWVRDGTARQIALIGKTSEDIRKVMIENGLLSIHTTQELTYYPGVNSLIWSNGAIATGYSAEVPRKLRGHQFDVAWLDELAFYDDPDAIWDQISMCMRCGVNPRILITTTPNSHPLIKSLLNQEGVVVTRGSTYDNSANLPESFISEIKKSYEGTVFGKQEIYGELPVSDSLWDLTWIKRLDGHMPNLDHIVIGLDPAVTAYGDETGIVVVGMDRHGKLYVLEDASGNFSVNEWSQIVREQFTKHNAHLVVAEVNQGGDMVESMLQDMPVESVRAIKGKVARAARIARLYEQGWVTHCDDFNALEAQMLQFETCRSPDRVDALVWAAQFLSQ